jgi:molecular chaperone GrpE
MSEDAENPENDAPAKPSDAGSATDPTGNGKPGDPAAVPTRDDVKDDAKDGLLIEVDASESPAARISALEADLARLSQDKKELWDKFVRATADLENFRKRARRDLEDAKHDARTRVLKEMLPVVDNLERAVAHSASTDAGAEAVLEGVRLVLRQFTHAFERTEVTPVEADGKPFDPNLHEAIGQEESDAPPGTVVNVLQRGYKLGDKLLRPALVVVAKARSTPPPEAEAGVAGETSDGGGERGEGGGDGGGGGEPGAGGSEA